MLKTLTILFLIENFSFGLANTSIKVHHSQYLNILTSLATATTHVTIKMERKSTKLCNLLTCQPVNISMKNLPILWCLALNFLLGSFLFWTEN